MAGALPAEIIAGISFIGRGGGAVKALDGFKKGHHSVPDAANAVTNGFLAKICATELEEQAEALFQSVRTGLGYKRRDVSLETGPAVATLSARDFTVEIAYTLESSDPARYAITQTLLHLRSGALAQTDEFAAIFAGMFSEISFALKKGAPVEAVVDAIEALDGKHGLAVDYPADCSQCRIAAKGVTAEIRFTGATLEMVFPGTGSPRDLMTEFERVRDAFAVSRELAGLIG
jgi:hypothetical protein